MKGLFAVAHLYVGAVLCFNDAPPAARFVPETKLGALRPDVVFLQSSEPLATVEIEGLSERYDYFVEWGAGRRSAAILLYTGIHTLDVRATPIGRPGEPVVRRLRIVAPNPRAKAVRP